MPTPASQRRDSPAGERALGCGRPWQRCDPDFSPGGRVTARVGRPCDSPLPRESPALFPFWAAAGPGRSRRRSCRREGRPPCAPSPRATPRSRCATLPPGGSVLSLLGLATLRSPRVLELRLLAGVPGALYASNPVAPVRRSHCGIPKGSTQSWDSRLPPKGTEQCPSLERVLSPPARLRGSKPLGLPLSVCC